MFLSSNSRRLCSLLKDLGKCQRNLNQFTGGKNEFLYYDTLFSNKKPNSFKRLCCTYKTAIVTYQRSITSNIDATNYEADLKSTDKIAKSSTASEAISNDVALEDMPVEMENPYERKKTVCILCKYGIELDYKNPKLLSQFISPYTGQIYGRHITRLCLKQQKKLESTIKKSREAGFLAVMVKSVEFLKDPLLFDPNNPIRPHKY